MDRPMKETSDKTKSHQVTLSNLKNVETNPQDEPQSSHKLSDHGTHEHSGSIIVSSEPTDVLLDDSDDNNKSSVPSYAASVFTVESLASSASALSNMGDYSAEQIATATRRLVIIIAEDELLAPLYQRAIDSPDIGPSRLQRNLRRLFRAYADNLEEECEGRIEFLASRLVASKARYLAKYVVEKFQPRRSKQLARHHEQQDESSDDEDKSNTVDDSMFADLKVFGDFLVGSAAFEILRVQVQSFVLPKVPSIYSGEETKPRNRQRDNEKSVKMHTWGKWFEDASCMVDAFFLDTKDVLLAERALFLAYDAFRLATDAFLIQFGQLEPPLAQTMSRLRWRNTCGEPIFSDISEYRDNGISELVAHLERSVGSQVTAAAYNHRTGNQMYIAPRPVQWLCNGFVKLLTGASSSSRAGPCIPMHNTSGQSSAVITPANPSAPQSVLHLMACMHRNRSRKVLQQDILEDMHTDRELFRFMRKQYRRHRGLFRNLLSLKSVQGIFFVKFNLPIGSTVIVRDHNSNCVANIASLIGCECIPPPGIVEPAPNAQYRCIPGPPATYPPVPSEYLLLMFSNPNEVELTDDWVLRQLPKRTCGRLQGQAGQPAEGWGVYYQEGWDRDLISVMIFTVFLIASVLFGALWSMFKFDIQGAFGIAAYMVAVCAALIPLIAMGLDKPR
ncbi:hypothetical protein M3J09_003751 [Ascochyta lentis]